MTRVKAISIVVVGVVLLLVATQALADKASIARGEHLVTILGCGQCHTDGQLIDWNDGQWLAGSTIGIAYTEHDPFSYPGVVFPGNLTSDKKTGLGKWTRKQIRDMLTTGVDHVGKQRISVMPWPNYRLLSEQETSDIADYLQSLPPVELEVPENVPPGQPSGDPYVRFGIYYFDPDETNRQILFENEPTCQSKNPDERPENC